MRLTAFALLSLMLLYTLGCPLPSLSRDNVSKNTNAQGDIAVTVTSGDSTRPLPTRHEIVELSALKEAPPIPNGFKLYRNLLFTVSSTATEHLNDVAQPPYVVTVKLPGDISQSEFSQLRILNLYFDDLSSNYASWLDCTVGTQPQDFNPPAISQTRLEQARPDFAGRSLSALTSNNFPFAVVLRDEGLRQPQQPFTRLDVHTSYPSEQLRDGAQADVTVTVTNQGPRPAGSVLVDISPDHQMKLLSVNMSQGNQVRDTLFQLGLLPVGATARVVMTVKVKGYFPETGKGTPAEKYDDASTEVHYIYKEHPNDYYPNGDSFITSVRVVR
ncbi:MAG: DUF11 domain-containing protein [Acidobacteria bacterium]|nr:DUF11 domain-containing protein [Acidobacteriota bacterium]